MRLSSPTVNSRHGARCALRPRARTREGIPPYMCLYWPAEIVQLCQSRAALGDTHTLWDTSGSSCSYSPVPRRHAGPLAYGLRRALRLALWHSGTATRPALPPLLPNAFLVTAIQAVLTRFNEDEYPGPCRACFTPTTREFS